MISAATKVFAVVGDPVGHSLSPLMHNAWLKAAGIDGVYVALRLPLAVAARGLAGLEAAGLAGINVTVPLKEAAAQTFPSADPYVRAVGAANTLVRAADGFTAHNTDGPGFLASLDAAAPGWRDRGRAALVLGAGGAGRGVAFALSHAGLDTIIANRTRDRAEAVAASVPCARVVDWVDLPDAFAVADLIVNATSLGLAGGTAAPLWPIEAARARAIVVDIVYRPLSTGLLQAAAARGLVTIDGLGMLIYQGALAFDLWTGVKPDVGGARALLCAALGENE